LKFFALVRCEQFFGLFNGSDSRQPYISVRSFNLANFSLHFGHIYRLRFQQTFKIHLPNADIRLPTDRFFLELGSQLLQSFYLVI